MKISDKALIVSYVAFGLAASWALLAHDPLIGFDGFRYGILGKNLACGQGYTFSGRPHIWFPPFYPFVVGIFYMFIRNAEAAARTASLVSFAAASVLFFKLAYLGYGRRAAHLSTIMFVTNTLLLTYSHRIYPHSLDTALVIASLYCALAIIKDEAVPYKRAFAAGALLACAVLTRPDNILLFMAIVILIPVLKKGRVPARVVASACIAVTVIALVFPYVYYLRLNTGIWTPTMKIITLQYYEYVKTGKSYGTLPSNEEFLLYVRNLHAHLGELSGRYFSGSIKMITELFFNTLRPLGVFAWALIILGLREKAAGPDNRRADILIAGSLAVLAIYPFGNTRPRYFICAIPALLLWAGRGAENAYLFLRSRLPSARQRGYSALGAVAVGAYCICAAHITAVDTSGPVPYPETEHKAMGLWMGAHIADIEQKRICSTQPFASFYSGGIHMAWPPLIPYRTFRSLLHYMKETHIDYLVVDEFSVRTIKDAGDLFSSLLNGPDEYMGLTKVHTISAPKKIILYKYTGDARDPSPG